MSNRGTASLGLYIEFQAAVLRQLPRPENVDSSIFEGWKDNQAGLKKVLAEALLPPIGDFDALSFPPSLAKLSFEKALEKAYSLLGMAAEYAEFVKEFGNHQTPGSWTLPMVKAEEKDGEGKVIGFKLTCNRVFAVLKAELVKVGKDAWSYYDDLDKAVADDPAKKIKRNQRDPNRDGSYSVSFKATVEADPENANQSAGERKRKDCVDITLLERLFLELVYFLMTGKHLDTKNRTLCADSRDSDGDVPSMYFNSPNRNVSVDYWNSSSHDIFFRARAAVPRQPKG